jgi:hypothetical protein
MWEPRHLTTLWASTASYKDSFTFIETILPLPKNKELHNFCSSPNIIIEMRQKWIVCEDVNWFHVQDKFSSWRL